MNGARPSPGFGKSRRAERRRAAPVTNREGVGWGSRGKGQNSGKGGCLDTLEGRIFVPSGSGGAVFRGIEILTQ